MSPLWILKRLRSMSAREVLHRTREKAKKISAKGRLEGWPRYQRGGAAPALPCFREHVAGFGEETRQKIAHTALQLLEGRFSALGREWPPRTPDNLFPAELWRLDPVRGTLWPGPEKYCFDIPYRHEQKRGDVKYVWEINRLQFLHPLAAHVFFTGDTDALAAIESAVASWCAAHPPYRGLAWNSGIEIALRAISLLIVSSLVGDKLQPDIVAKIRATLAASLFWVERFPSLYSSANNHLIAEMAGSYLIAIAMPNLGRARDIRGHARSILGQEAQKQFHQDGVPAEQSPSYGAFSAELLLLCHASGALAAPARARLDHFADFIFWLADKNGRVPSIGDDDEGRVLCFEPADPRYAFDIGRRIKSPATPRGVRSFHAGGYSVIRDARWHVVFDHGPLGYLAIAAHGHADALSLCLSLDGIPLLVDPGTYLYHSGGKERDWFRGTPAHNTLNIGGHDQSLTSGPFNWSHKARCRLDEARDGADWRISARHDGYEKRFGVCHCRTIASDGSGLVIVDRLLGGAREAEIVLQLAPELSAHRDGAQCHVIRDTHTIAIFSFEAPGDVVLGEGHVSPAFGVKIAAPRLVWKGQVDESGASIRITPA